MKYEIKDPNPEFVPFTVSITIESLEELGYLVGALNLNRESIYNQSKYVHKDGMVMFCNGLWNVLSERWMSFGGKPCLDD